MNLDDSLYAHSSDSENLTADALEWSASDIEEIPLSSGLADNSSTALQPTLTTLAIDTDQALLEAPIGHQSWSNDGPGRHHNRIRRGDGPESKENLPDPHDNYAF
jgi:hypothetical protein